MKFQIGSAIQRIQKSRMFFSNSKRLAQLQNEGDGILLKKGITRSVPSGWEKGGREKIPSRKESGENDTVLI
jgi:hypothetical protein